MRRLLAEQEELRLQRGEREDWFRKVTELNAVLRIYKAVRAASYGADIWKEHGSKSQQANSKGRQLLRVARKHPDWRASLLEGMQETGYLDATRVSVLVGPRPVELTKGVTLTRRDESSCVITVKGAKVSQASGQEWREIAIPMADLWPDWRERLKAEGSFEVRISSPAAYKESMRRVSCCRDIAVSCSFMDAFGIATLDADSRPAPARGRSSGDQNSPPT